MVQSFFNRKPALVSFPYVARVKLAGLESDRSFIETVVALRRLGDDPSVGGLLLQIDRLDLGYGRIEELRAVLADINRRKPVFAWLSQPDDRRILPGLGLPARWPCTRPATCSWGAWPRR